MISSFFSNCCLMIFRARVWCGSGDEGGWPPRRYERYMCSLWLLLMGFNFRNFFFSVFYNRHENYQTNRGTHFELNLAIFRFLFGGEHPIGFLKCDEHKLCNVT